MSSVSNHGIERLWAQKWKIRINPIPATVLVLGITLSIGLGGVVRESERSVIRTSYQTNYDKEKHAIVSKLISYRQTLLSLALYMEGTEIANSSEFRRAASEILRLNPAIVNLMWLPRITDEKRDEYEAKNSKLNPGYSILQRNPITTAITKAEKSDNYYPIEYIAPEDITSLNLKGIDIGANPSSLQAMLKSIVSSEPVAIIKDEEEMNNVKQAMQFYPVFDLENKGYDNAEEEPDDTSFKDLRGFVAATFNIESLITNVNKANLSGDDMFFCLLDKQGNKVVPLYQTRIWPDNPIDDSYEPAVSPINVFGRELELIGKPTRLYVKALSHGTTGMVLSSGFAITVLLAAYFQSLINRNKTINQTVASQTAELLKVNNQLEKLSSTDPLTGVLNRRALNASLEKEWKRCKREVKPLTMAMLDIDYFKQYNDTYGHLLGDEALKKVAASIASQCKRSVDIVARYGGEEFAVVLPSVDQPREFLDRINRSIHDLFIPHESSPISQTLTASIGAVSCIPLDDASIEDFVAEVDKQLYKAKGDGRNCLSVKNYAV